MSMIKGITCMGALALAIAVSTARAAAPADIHEAVAKDFDKRLKSLFLHFHQNPELSFRESKTAARLAKELRALGYKVTEKVGGTGVVAVMRNGDGPTVMLRADMDGLPVEENSGLAYASKVKQKDMHGELRPVMHACGHDVHVTALIGAARQLAEHKQDWAGTLVLIGQPAEELISGARAMIEDGLYTRFPKPDVALAFHVSSGSAAGVLQVPPDIAYSSSDSVDIIVHGIGGHGASPHETVDPVLVASQIVVSLQSIVSRNINPLQPAVITVGAIHGGSKHNIIGERVDMQLTVRSDSAEVRQQLLDDIDRVAKGVAISMGVPDDKLPEVIRSKTESTPPTINDTASAELVRTALTGQFGADRMEMKPRDGMGAEDFAYFVAPEHGVKGVYFSVGGAMPADLAKPTPHHSPIFRVDYEPAVKAGAEAMAVGAMALLGKP